MVLLDKVFLILYFLFLVISIKLSIYSENSFLFMLNLFFFMLYLLNKKFNKEKIKYYYIYYVFLFSRLYLLYFFNFDLFFLILLFLPEIFGLSMFFIKLGAISMASLGSVIIFYFLINNKIISTLLFLITIISILLSLYEFSKVSIKYIPKKFIKFLKLIYYTFLLNKITKYYKKIDKKIINISCWIQFLIVYVIATLNNTIILSNTSFLAIVNLFSFVLFTLVLISYLYYHKFKNVSLLNIGYDIFISWTEEFGKISKIALHFHNNDNIPYILKVIYKNKKFIYLILITNLISLFFASYTIFWILNYKILPIILGKFGLEFYSFYIALFSSLYLLYTYIYNYYKSIKKYINSQTTS